MLQVLFQDLEHVQREEYSFEILWPSDEEGRIQSDLTGSSLFFQVSSLKTWLLIHHQCSLDQLSVHVSWVENFLAICIGEGNQFFSNLVKEQAGNQLLLIFLHSHLHLSAEAAAAAVWNFEGWEGEGERKEVSFQHFHASKSILATYIHIHQLAQLQFFGNLHELKFNFFDVPFLPLFQKIDVRKAKLYFFEVCQREINSKYVLCKRGEAAHDIMAATSYVSIHTYRGAYWDNSGLGKWSWRGAKKGEVVEEDTLPLH